MWHKKLTLFLNLAITSLIILLMVCGDLLRYYWPIAYMAISNYETLKQNRLRNYLKQVHFNTDRQIEEYLRKYKSFNSSKIRRYQWWNSDTDFYDLFPTSNYRATGDKSSQSAYENLIRKLGEV